MTMRLDEIRLADDRWPGLAASEDLRVQAQCVLKISERLPNKIWCRALPVQTIDASAESGQ